MSLSEELMRQEIRCAQSLVEFRKVHLAGEKDVEPPDFHRVWSDILLHGRENYAIEGFRESGKDQIVFQANIMHALTYPVDYRSYILMVGANKTDMSSKLKDITRRWQSPQHDALRVNVSKVVEDSGDAFEVLYKNGMRVRIETYGKGGSIRGRVWGIKRPDIVILNDIQDPADMLSDLIPEKDWDWFLSDVLFLGKASRLFLIGNNIGARCVIERVIAYARSLNFKSMRIGIATSLEDDGVTVKVGEPTWPQRHSKEEILAEYLSLKSLGKADHYMREKMCINMAPASHPLRSGKLVEFDWHDPAIIDDLKDAVVTTVVDPAISKKRGADPTVIGTVADSRLGRRYILDLDRRQRNPNETVNDIFRAVSRYQPSSLGIESVAYQAALITMIENERRIRQIPPDAVKIVEIHTRQNKELKIAGRLQPMLEAGLIYVPKGASWLEAFRAEIDAFPDGEHDDMIDTVSMADDAKVRKLIPTFIASECVVESVKAPENWPRWAALAARPNGTATVLLLTCSPEGRLYVTDEVLATGSPSALYAKYAQMLRGRSCQMVFAPGEMFAPDPLTGNVWAGSYMGAGFPLCPGSTEWRTILPTVAEMFDKPTSGAQPRLLVCRACSNLIWEMTNAAEGDERKPDYIGLRALMMIVAHRPSWRDTSNDDAYGGEVLRYPDADVP